MLTKITEEDKVLAREVFDACLLAAWGQEGTAAKFLEALHYFTARNITLAYSKLRALASVAEREHLVQKFDSTIIRAHMSAAGAFFRHGAACGAHL